MKVRDAMENAGQFILSMHAKERIRQRLGIDSDDSAVAWVKEAISKASDSFKSEHRTHYISGSFEIICDGAKIITVKPTDSSNEYLTVFGELIAKETSKMLRKFRQEIRKTDINIAQLNLNYLRAKNPNTKETIAERLTEAIDRKASIEDEIKAVEYAARRYGAEA